MMQMTPRLMPGDTALTGEGRTLSVHVFDSLPQCQVRAHLRHLNGSTQAVDLHMNLPPRLHCDPIVYLSRIQKICREQNWKGASFDSLDFFIVAKRTTDKHWTKIVDSKNVCHQKLEYSFLRHNPWIIASSGRRHK